MSTIMREGGASSFLAKMKGAKGEKPMKGEKGEKGKKGKGKSC